MIDDKIVLTINDIYKEFKKNRRDSFFIGIFLLILTLSFTVPPFFILLDRGNEAIWLFVLFWAFIGTLIIWDLCYAISIYRAFKKNTFVVEVDELIDKKFLWFYDDNDKVLFFSKYGKYFIYDHGLYNRIKKEYTLTDYELFRSSKVGDTFYVASHNGKDVFMIYNTKYFEYKEPDIEDLFSME